MSQRIVGLNGLFVPPGYTQLAINAASAVPGRAPGTHQNVTSVYVLCCNACGCLVGNTVIHDDTCGPRREGTLVPG